MARSKRNRKVPEGTPGTSPPVDPPRSPRPRPLPLVAAALLLGAVLGTGGTMLATSRQGGPFAQGYNSVPVVANEPSPVLPTEPERGDCRSVAELMAIRDADLERVDLIEMNIAVAREIPGLEGLEYARYRDIADQWTQRFARWLPTVEHAFHETPSAFHDDIAFFRMGMLAQFLDEAVGIRYVEEQKRAQLAARDAGRRPVVYYTDPGHLLLHGLIDTKRGTCGTMPALHVAIARRMGWPVALACADSHYVCRYDDGQHVYNIEATDTGRGGFAAGSDQDYIEKEGVSRKAIAVGSDLRKLTAREMLGVFVQARARHFADTGKIDLAARDYALAHTLFPNSRKVYIGLVGNLLPVGEKLFARNEHGHPMSLAAYLSGMYAPRSSNTGLARSPIYQHDPILEVERINAINQANMRRMMQPPMAPQPYQPPVPGVPHSPQPHRQR